MKLAVNLRSLRRFQNAAWQPSALRVQLSKASISARLDRLLTRLVMAFCDLIELLRAQIDNFMSRIPEFMLSRLREASA